MTGKYTQHKGRMHQRWYLTGERTAWSRSPGQRLMSAGIHDISSSGIAMLVDPAVKPRQGEIVRVVSSDQLTPRRARIVRVVDREDGNTLVGCRWVSSSASSRRRRSSSRFMQHIKQARKNNPPAPRCDSQGDTSNG